MLHLERPLVCAQLLLRLHLAELEEAAALTAHEAAGRKHPNPNLNPNPNPDPNPNPNLNRTPTPTPSPNPSPSQAAGGKHAALELLRGPAAAAAGGASTETAP